jgi:predicted RNase H-like nuclease (RuvC/YqgF family)
MNEAVAHEEISSLRAALAAKTPLLQLVAATPMTEQRATKQLRSENAALRREIDEIEIRHLNELKQMRAQYASLAARPMPTDGRAHCKRRIRELESEIQKLSAEIERLQSQT